MATFLCLNEVFYDGPWVWSSAAQVDLPSPTGFAKAAEQAVTEFDRGEYPIALGNEAIDVMLLVKSQASGEIRRFRVERHVRYLAFQDNTVQPPKEDAHESV